MEQSRQSLSGELVTDNGLQGKLVAVRGKAESNPDLPFEVLDRKVHGGENQVLLKIRRRHVVERRIARVILNAGLEVGDTLRVNTTIEVQRRNAAGVLPGR